ncbi:MAG: hypothetical protein PHC41_10240 [Lachnospiraceae bacterium]|nr:hypothetical protein [Lachnospiraceae bacterium]MDD3616590.1 hypothetical protein [Lachnospiraceae bacterium]
MKFKQSLGLTLAALTAACQIAAYTVPVLAKGNTTENTSISAQAEEKSGENEASSGASTNTPSAGPTTGSSTSSSTTASSPDREIPTIILSAGEGQTTPEYTSGEKKTLTVQVKNTGSVTANRVTIIPVLGATTDEWPFEITNIDNNQELGDIESGKSADISYDLTARADVESKYYKLTFKIQYNDGKYQYTNDKYFFVKMTGNTEAPDGGDGSEIPGGDLSGGGSFDYGDSSGGGISNGDSSESTNGSVPRVIITGFSTNPSEVKAGDDFTLNITIKNTSKKTAVKNMVFVFDAPTEGTDAATTAASFLPVSGANSIYKDEIKANSETTISIDLNAKSDLVQKPYSIDVSMKYEDKDAQQYDSTSSVSIPVKQDPRFEFSTINVSPASIQVGEDANVNCSLYNLGKIKLYNVKAKLEGPGVNCPETFVGNVESGATATIDLMATGETSTAGPQPMQLVCSYEDADGNVTTVKQEVTLEIMEAMMGDEGEMEMMTTMEAENPGLPWKIIIPAAIGALVLIIVVIVILKKKKAKLNDELF